MSSLGDTVCGLDYNLNDYAVSTVLIVENDEVVFLCLQVSHPDEFDVMFPISVARASINPFREDGAFYSVSLKRGEDPLKRFQENNILSASKMLDEFRKEVLKCVKTFSGEYQYDMQADKTPFPSRHVKVSLFF